LFDPFHACRDIVFCATGYFSYLTIGLVFEEEQDDGFINFIHCQIQEKSSLYSGSCPSCLGFGRSMSVMSVLINTDFLLSWLNLARIQTFSAIRNTQELTDDSFLKPGRAFQTCSITSWNKSSVSAAFVEYDRQIR